MISIVIATHNQKELLLATLAGLKEVDYNQVEVIVYDNNSDDGTADVVEQAFPRVRMLKGEYDLGVAKGFNKAVEKSRGDYLVALQPGVEIKITEVEKGIKYLEETPDVNMVTGQLVVDGLNQAQAHMRFGLNKVLKTVSQNKIAVGKKAVKLNKKIDIDCADIYLIVNSQKQDRVPFWLDENYQVGFAFLDFCKQVKVQSGRIVYLPELRAKFKSEPENKIKRKALKKDAQIFVRKWLNKNFLLIIKLLK